MNPELVRIAKGLRRRKRGNSLRAIAADLAARGCLNVNGRAYSAASVASMLHCSHGTLLDQMFTSELTSLPEERIVYLLYASGSEEPPWWGMVAHGAAFVADIEDRGTS